MVQVREALDASYLLGDTVPGYRSCHYFVSSSTTLIKAKQHSDEHVYTVKDQSFSAIPTVSEIALTFKTNNYVTCIFYGFWWLVLVDSINNDEKVVTCQFSYLHGPRKSVSQL